MRHPKRIGCHRLALASSALLTLFLTSLAALGTAAGAVLASGLGMLLIVSIVFWQVRCHPGACEHILTYLVGAAFGTALLAVLTLAGISAGPLGLALAAILVGILTALGIALRCLSLWRT